jgi:hypothetical protein
MIFYFYAIKKSHFKNLWRPTTNRLVTHQFEKCWLNHLQESDDYTPSTMETKVHHHQSVTQNVTSSLEIY